MPFSSLGDAFPTLSVYEHTVCMYVLYEVISELVVYLLSTHLCAVVAWVFCVSYECLHLCEASIP